MNWFKHMTCSYSDERLSAVVDELGMEGYGFWWRLLEVIGDKLDASGDTSCSFSPKKWGSFFGFSAKKFQKFAEIFAEKKLLILEISEKTISVNVPNLLKYNDEYTRRKRKKSGQAPDNCPDNIPPRKEENRKDINIPPLSPPEGGECVSQTPEPAVSEPQDSQPETPPKEPYTQEFQDFWACYPRKTGKDAAFRAWKNRKRSKTLPGIDALTAAIERARASPDWQREGGRFIPHPTTWLNQGRWLDEDNGDLGGENFKIPDWAKHGYQQEAAG